MTRLAPKEMVFVMRSRLGLPVDDVAPHAPFCTCKKASLLTEDHMLGCPVGVTHPATT